MKMIKLLLVSNAIVVFGAALADAGPVDGGFEKGGHACFAEVCMWDKLESLRNLDFYPAPPLGPPNNPGHQYGREQFPGHHRDVYGFWDDSLYPTVSQRKLDASFLEFSERYSRVCPDDGLRAPPGTSFRSPLQLSGAYKTETGLQTDIRVTLVPDLEDPDLRTRFFVTSLTRYIPVSDSGEAERVEAMVKERYRDFGIRSQKRSHVRTQYKLSPSPHVEINMSLPVGTALATTGHPWRALTQVSRCTSHATPGID